MPTLDPEAAVGTTDPGHDAEPRPAPELQEIVEHYLGDRRPGAPDLVVARSTLEWARSALDDVEVDILVMGAHEAIRRNSAPADTGLDGRTVAMLQAADRTALTTRKPYLDLPRDELDELMALGLVELGEWQATVTAAQELGPPPAGRVDYRTLTPHEYREWVYTDRQGEGALDLVFGWLPGAIAGLVVGLVAALVTGDWAHLVVVVLVGAVAGYVATGLGHRALEAMDVAHLRLGHRLEHEAWGVLYFGAGPLIAVITAWLLIASV